jgi:hypothetical protein
MTRPPLPAALGLLSACARTATPEQVRARCEAERTRRGISRLLPPESRQSPDCAPASR